MFPVYGSFCEEMFSAEYDAGNNPDVKTVKTKNLICQVTKRKWKSML